MPVTITLARAWARQRRPALVALAVVIAVGAAIALTALESARRTEQAYPNYLREAEVGDLIVNPSLPTDRAEEVVAATPGILSYASDSMLSVSLDDGAPRTQAEIDSSTVQGRVSTDGRYSAQDRPVLKEGRFPESGREAFVSLNLAKRLDLEVGDELPMAFWTTGYVGESFGDQGGVLVKPLGRTVVRVVGIGILADEVLLDELYTLERVVVTPDVAAPYDCRIHHPDEHDPRSAVELTAALVPPDCSMSYRYYSLRVDGGAGGVAAVVAAMSDRFQRENEHLPASFQANDISFSMIPSVTAEQRDRVQRSLDPAVTALRIFGAASLLATLVVALLAALRVARRHEQDARMWRDLGVTRLQRVLSLAFPLLVAAAVGLLLAVPLGVAASRIGAVGSARVLDGTNGYGLSPVLTIGTLGAASLILLAGVLGGAVLVGRAGMSRAPRRPSSAAQSISKRFAPATGRGISAALAGSGAATLLAASVAAITAVMATLVFSTSLDRFVNRPAEYGWPYDLGVMVGFGYGGATPDVIAASLDRPEVVGWGLAGTAGEFQVDGHSVPVVSDRQGFIDLGVTIIDGTLPQGADEVALGSLTARQFGIDVGDRVDLSCPYGEGSAVVTGLAVLPAIGPFESDRSSLGTGALMPAAVLEALVADGEQAAGVPPRTFADGLATFVAIDLRDGVDRGAFLRSLGPLTSWDLNGYEPFTLSDPVRPALVADVASMRGVPVLLGQVFAVTMGAALVLGIAVVTRARRRELALLGALGCTPRQLRASVRSHAITVVAVGLLIGLPIGAAIGRSLYRAFATDLGVAPVPVVSLGWTALVVAATVAVGISAAIGPGRHSSRQLTSIALREGTPEA